MPASRAGLPLAAFLLAASALGGWPAMLPGAAAASPGAVEARPAGFADLVEQVAPAVVQIAVITLEGAERGRAEPPAHPHRGTNPGGQARRGNPAPHRTLGEGSGFVVDPSGLVVTNFHVAGRPAERILVAFADGLVLPARVVGVDERTDLALLRVEPPHPLPTVRFAEGAAPRVGDWVLAAGNPFGLGPSVSVGIVSARGRVLGAGPYDDFLQTDAPINPGNSGGPLFDLDGRVVGVNTAIVSPSGGSAGIGFAVPAEIASRVVAALRTDGRVSRGWLGVEADAVAEGASEGAQVAAVSPEGPGARAGLRPGDVVTAIGEQPVRDARTLARLVADHPPGSEVSLTVARGADTLVLHTVVQDQPTLPPIR